MRRTDAATAFDLQNVISHGPVWGLELNAEVEALVRSVRAASQASLNASDALHFADAASYSLCWDRAVAALVWAPGGGERTRGGPVLALRPQFKGVGLLVECPHPLADRNGAQAGALLTRARRPTVRAMLMSGHHRCVDNSQRTPCDGMTGMCAAHEGLNAATSSGMQPYPRSDPAHSTSCAYHALHVALFGSTASSSSSTTPFGAVVALHGMAANGVSVSDGTTLSTNADAPVAVFANALATRLRVNVTLCNKGGGLPHRAHLCATTDVQGRHVNGMPDTCRAAGHTQRSTGRFIHVEQSAVARSAAKVHALAGALDALAAHLVSQQQGQPGSQLTGRTSPVSFLPR